MSVHFIGFSQLRLKKVNNMFSQMLLPTWTKLHTMPGSFEYSLLKLRRHVDKTILLFLYVYSIGTYCIAPLMVVSQVDCKLTG